MYVTEPIAIADSATHAAVTGTNRRIACSPDVASFSAATLNPISALIDVIANPMPAIRWPGLPRLNSDSSPAPWLWR
jgi:hypothetical protein